MKDIEFYGEPDLFKCLSKAWSQEEGWMKSTKAMNVPVGVIIQVTTQQGERIAEALTFVPGCVVVKTRSGGADYDYRIEPIAPEPVPAPMG